ncbi:MAG: hypothetical protein QM765_06140 [Myxococcales bacterium]
MSLALLVSLLVAAADPPPQPPPPPPAESAAAPSTDGTDGAHAAEPSPAPAPAADAAPPAVQPTSAQAPSPALVPAVATSPAPAAPAVTQLAAPAPTLASARALDAPWTSRPVAIGLSFVPGVVIPGLGHRLTGDPRTANRLLLTSGLGVAATLAGGATLLFTGGNHDVAPYGMALLFAGVSTWMASWLGDVVGTLRPEGQVRPFQREDSLTAALLYGPSLAHSGSVKHLGILRADYESPKVLLDGWASLAPGTRYQEIHLRGGLKLYGDDKRSHLALVLEGLREIGADSDANGHGAALMLEGRIDAGVLDRSMTGLVFIQRIGGGAIAYSYDGSAATDLQPLLVLETGLSLALTDWFEVSAVYSQRPDKRLGMVFDHGGHAEAQVRVEVHPKVRLLALTHIGGGMDVMLGAEVVAW